MASFAEQAEAAAASANPYGRNATGNTGTTASFRQRGDATQKRVNDDTRVRSDANSGTAGVNGAQSGNVSMSDALAVDSDQQPPQQVPMGGVTWQATRQPVDLASVRQRVLQSLKPQQGQ